MGKDDAKLTFCSHNKKAGTLALSHPLTHEAKGVWSGASVFNATLVNERLSRSSPYFDESRSGYLVCVGGRRCSTQDERRSSVSGFSASAFYTAAAVDPMDQSRIRPFIHSCHSCCAWIQNNTTGGSSYVYTVVPVEAARPPQVRIFISRLQQHPSYETTFSRPVSR